mmetsp:Transcript_51746/g.120730  ORF Transcript_51746/g.120730 Transcript_51746/m.120730 type:complete len:222 (-) Transcript_51746:22-687(-)
MMRAGTEDEAMALCRLKQEMCHTLLNEREDREVELEMRLEEEMRRRQVAENEVERLTAVVASLVCNDQTALLQNALAEMSMRAEALQHAYKALEWQHITLQHAHASVEELASELQRQASVGSASDKGAACSFCSEEVTNCESLVPDVFSPQTSMEDIEATNLIPFDLEIQDKDEDGERSHHPLSATSTGSAWHGATAGLSPLLLTGLRVLDLRHSMCFASS